MNKPRKRSPKYKPASPGRLRGPRDLAACFLEAYPEAVGIMDAETQRPLYINPAARRLLGISDDVPVQQIDAATFRPGALMEEREKLIRSVRKHGQSSANVLVRRLDGAMIPVRQTMVQFRFDSTLGEWVIGDMMHEIKTPSFSDELAGRTRELIAGLADLGPQAYFVWDYAKGDMMAGNDRIAALYGYTEEELKACGGWGALEHPDDLPLMMRMLQRLERASKSAMFEEQVRIKRRDGNWELIRVRQRVLERDEKGKLVSAVGSSHVITHYLLPFDDLRAREEKYRAMVDEAGDGMFLFDDRGVIHQANRFLERLAGCKKGALCGKSIWEAFELPRKGGVPRDLSRFKHTRGKRILCHLQQPDKRLVSIDLRIRRLSTERYLGIARDMSDEMALAQATHRQAVYYRGLIENNTSGVAVFDKAWRIATTNRALAAMLKRPEKQVLGHSLVEFLAPESEAEGKRLLSQMKQEERFNTLHRHSVKLTLIDRRGARVHVQVALTAIRDKEDVFEQGIAIFTDITEEHRLREESDERARFNQALLSEAPVCILVLAPEGTILQINPATEQLTGYKSKQLVGKHLWKSGLIDEDQVAESRLRFQSLINGTNRVNSTLRIYTKGGGIRIVEVQSTAARKPDGETVCIISTAMDVTEHKRLEAEVIRVAEQEQMRIGNDLHDGVGQTLTGVLSLTEALEATLVDGPAKEAGRIRELVRDAIDQVRQLSHGLSPAAVKHRGLGASLRLLAQQTSSTRLRCVCRLDWEPVFKDHEAETHLFRIAQEAVANAVKHGRPKNITISLRLASETSGLMEIRDDGAGFQQSKSKRSEGIGIAVMRYRCGLFGGMLEISSPPNGGVLVACRFACPL